MKSIKFVFLKTIIVLFFVFNSASSYSQNSNENYVKQDAQNKVQFVGADENFLVFDLRFSELPVKGCTFRIMDEAGNTLLEETITASSYSRRYKVLRDVSSKLIFKASGKSFAFSQAFTIKTEARLVVTAE